MKTYTEMKACEISWINELPSHWGVRRIKTLPDISLENSFVDGDWIESPYITDSGIRYLTTGNIGDGFFKRQGKGFITEDTFGELNCKYAYPGDLVFSRLNAPYGRSCILPDDYPCYVLAVDNVILRTKENKKYLCYVSQCEGFHDAVADSAKGTTMKRISRTNLGVIQVPLPPVDEQNTIASYLDSRIEKIDAIIAEARTSIDEYKQWKASIIYEAVTKGLNTNVEMFDSGYGDIGKIPVHWRLGTIKNTFEIVCGATPTESQENWGGDIRWVGPADMPMFGTISEGKRTITNKGYNSCGTTLIPKGSIVLSTRAPIGKICIATEELCTNQGCKSLVPKTQVNTKYYAYYLFSITERMQQDGTGTTFKELSTSKLKSEPMPIVPIEEQNEITVFLDNKCAAIDALVLEKESLIAELELYKKSLIFEVVTGKRKVV